MYFKVKLNQWSTVEFTIVEGNFYVLMIGFKTKPIENGQMAFLLLSPDHLLRGPTILSGYYRWLYVRTKNNRFLYVDFLFLYYCSI